MSTLSRYGLSATQWLSKAIVPGMTISSMDLGSVAVGLATSSLGWDKMTAEGWINNKAMLELARNLHDR